MLFPGKKERNFTAGFRPYGIVGAAGGFYNTGTADENPAESEAVRRMLRIGGKYGVISGK